MEAKDAMSNLLKAQNENRNLHGIISDLEVRLKAEERAKLLAEIQIRELG